MITIIGEIMKKPTIIMMVINNDYEISLGFKSYPFVTIIMVVINHFDNHHW